MPKITDVLYFIFKITPVTAQYIICFLASSHSNLICGCLDIKPERDATLIILLEAIKIANDANRELEIWENEINSNDVCKYLDKFMGSVSTSVIQDKTCLFPKGWSPLKPEQWIK